MKDHRLAVGLRILLIGAGLTVLVAARKPLWTLTAKAALFSAELRVPSVSLSLLSEAVSVVTESAVSEAAVSVPTPSSLSAVSRISDGGDAVAAVTLAAGASDTVYKNIALTNVAEKQKVNLASQLTLRPAIHLYKNARPQVLILHTHTTEGYLQQRGETCDADWDGRDEDASRNVVAVGAVIAEKLNEAGIATVHLTEVFDSPEFSGAYDRAGAAIGAALKKYSSIDMVLDVHRDSITRADGTRVAPTVEIDGKTAAQVMILTGCNDTGALPFPNWEYNLRAAVWLQDSLTTMYDGLARPIYFAARRYNMHYTKSSLLIEVGSEVNTTDEALYAAELFSEALIAMLERL